MKKLLTIFIFFTFVVVRLFAQKEVKTEGFHTLPNYNATSAICLQNDTLWQATDDALIALDVKTQKILAFYDKKEIDSDTIQSLQISCIFYNKFNGALYFSVHGDFICKFKNGVFSKMPDCKGFYGKFVVDKSENIWQSSIFVGIIKNSKYTFVDENNPNVFKQNFVDVKIAPSGEPYFIGEKSVIFYLNGKCSTITPTKKSKSYWSKICDATMTPKGTLFMHGDYLDDDINFRIYQLPDTMKCPNLKGGAFCSNSKFSKIGLSPDENNLLCVDGYYNVVEIDKTGKVVKEISTIKKWWWYYTFLLDKYGQVWVLDVPNPGSSYYNGRLYVVSKNIVIPIIRQEPANLRSAFLHDGKRWLIDQNKLYTKDEKTALVSSIDLPKAYFDTSSFSYPYIRPIMGIGKEMVYMNGYTNNISLVLSDGKKFREKKVNIPTIDNANSHVFPLKTKFIIAYYGGSTKYQNFEVDTFGNSKIYTLPFDDNSGLIDFKTDENGKQWIATWNNIYYFENQHWKTVAYSFKNIYKKIIIGKNGTVFIQTSDKIYVVKKNNVIKILHDVYTGNSFYPNFVDSRGWLWVKKDFGIHCYDGYAGRTIYYTGKIYDNPNFTEDSKGTIWYGSSYYWTTNELYEGKIAYDLDNNCLKDKVEVALENNLIQLTNGTKTYETVSDENGNFQLFCPPNKYDVNVKLQKNLWENCSEDLLVDVQKNNKKSDTLRIKPKIMTPFLTMSVSAPRLRRCFDNTVAIKICNEGTIASVKTYAEITLPKGLDFVSSMFLYEKKPNGVISFDIGKLNVNECRELTLIANVNCKDVKLGETLCIEGKAKYDTLINNENLIWKNPHYIVDVACENSKLKMSVLNAGKIDASNVTYVIYKNDKIDENGVVSLKANERKSFSRSKDNNNWRIEVQQNPDYPFSDENPSLSISECNASKRSTNATVFTNNTTGRKNEAIECIEVRGSYDPNDKSAAPVGYGKEHFIEPNQRINYTIRFQNTGTDTAFTVIIKDKIDENLDLSTFKSDISSSPYRVIWNGNEASFIFDNINLPDSNVNLIASNGFVRYSIKAKKNTILGTTINNTAAIYFDFNEPIITNTVSHKIQKDFLPKEENKKVVNEKLKIDFYPNPTSEKAIVTFDKTVPENATSIAVYDILGKKVQSYPIREVITIEKDNLQAGIYTVALIGDGHILGVGKLIIQ